MKTILKARVGSHLYELDTPESDEDFLGVFVRPTQEVLGFGNDKDSYETKNPDTKMYEVKRFMSLAAGGNPSVLELLYCPNYEIMLIEGESLVNHRECFLSNRVRDSFGGYAYQQAKKLQKRTEDGLEGFNPAVKKRTPKHARHCLRLLQQGKELLKTGVINPVVKNRDELFAVGEMPVEEIIKRFEEEYALFKEAESILPDEPDWVSLNKILLGIRKVN